MNIHRLTKNAEVWVILDDMGNEVCLIVLEEGELSFYKECEEDSDNDKH